LTCRIIDTYRIKKLLMARWKSNLINAYRFASWPYRQMRLRQMILARKVPVAILYYHRVDNSCPNPWTISEIDFQRQIDWFQQNFDLVNLEECQRRISRGANTRPTLSITFDDGYADNCSSALPMLISRGIPVTYFVTTFHTTLDKPFQHDIALETPLAPNSIDSLIALANAGVEIGSHTRNHVDVGRIRDPETLFDEVITSTREMEQLIQKPIRYFAFPYGLRENLNPAVFRLLKEHGFKGACSAYGGLNYMGDDSFHLQRIHGDPCLARMKNWLTLDPRLELVGRYDYSTEPQIHSSRDLSSELEQPPTHRQTIS
jgi:peptidoglycan/xylan/chitin deacetylase (PgdA/CDA1 family)